MSVDIDGLPRSKLSNNTVYRAILWSNENWSTEVSEKEHRSDIESAKNRPPPDVYSLAKRSFSHPKKSRFNDKSFGIFYCAVNYEIAVKEFSFHLNKHFEEKKSPKRTVRCHIISAQVKFATLHDVQDLRDAKCIYDSDDYEESRKFGKKIQKAGGDGIHYCSVRMENKDNKCYECYGLMKYDLLSDIRKFWKFDFYFNPGSEPRIEYLDHEDEI